MTLAVFTIALQASVFFIVLSLGLQSTWQEALSLFGRPAMLARSLLSMNVVMPVLAALAATWFHLNPEVKIALVLLAVSPTPPLLPRKLLQLGGRGAYVRGLLTAMSLLSIVVVPVAVEILGKIFGRDVHIGPAAVAGVVGKTILLPLGLGIVIRLRATELAGRAGAMLGRAGNLLLPLAAIPLIFLAGRLILGVIGHGAILVMAAFTVIGAAVGHGMGGRDRSERSALALATASRHPGLVIAIAAANFPDQKKLVAAVVLLYLLVSTAILLPYTIWRKRQVALGPPNAKPGNGMGRY